MADRSQQTEKPTPQRIRKAREQGRFASSREFVSAAGFVLAAALITSKMPAWLDQFRALARGLVRTAFALEELRAADITRLFRVIAELAMLPLLLGGAAMLAVGLTAQIAATRFGFSAAGLSPKFERLNPLTRLREMPAQNSWMAMQALILLPVFGFALYYALADAGAAFLRLPLGSARSGIALVALTFKALVLKAALLFAVIGLVDFVRQQRKYTKSLMMSKQEIRDEFKEQEGDPLIRQRVRRMMRDLGRRRMMAAVPTATAVVTNPTHFAVAIRYVPEEMAAPKVVAKGRNFLALRIREKAIAHGVPIIENPPLAQALYKSVAVGQEIPAVFYRAVAEILAYIYRLMRGRN
ncbi:MAG: EscU/YscU/HrcU family type III secretion system export apparatus switch protein [Bryobacter sp.]|jgi:flagellar biosynthetic protein FlhB|nr:EscU/YscU/HrcU family type III secretion system export apparatus switch protein [Bryobacter sp.]